MWVDFTMVSKNGNETPATMHFISEAAVVFDPEKQMVELNYNEPSEADDIRVQMIVLPESVFVFRSGQYSMEQSFDMKTMTTGELTLPEGSLNLMTTTTRYEKSIDFSKREGNVELDYTMFVEEEYSGDFRFQLKFYGDEKEIAK